MTSLRKLRGFMTVAINHPDEAISRLRYYLVVRPLRVISPAPDLPAYDVRPFSDLCAAIGKTFGRDIDPLLSEDAFVHVHAHLRQRMREVSEASTIGSHQNGGDSLGQLCYLACRVLRPSVVVETGVAHGLTSSYILAALHQNGHGHLHSIDLPPLGDKTEDFVGAFIPPALRYRHHLIRGDARRKLPELLRLVGQCDLFVHDSDHSYAHTAFELKAVLRHLQRPGIILCDDAGMSAAFDEFLYDALPDFGIVVQRHHDDSGIVGAAIFTTRSPASFNSACAAITATSPSVK